MIVVILCVILTLLVLKFSRPTTRYWHFYKKIRKVPWAKDFIPLFGHALQIFVPLNKMMETITAVTKRNPPFFIFWVGPFPMLVLIEPKHLEVILGSVKCIDKSIQYSFFHPWLGTGLLTSTGSKWHSHRKMITPTFHFKILENFVEVFVKKSEILVKKLENELGSEKFDIYPYITLCALDIISETAMGIESNTQKEQMQSEYTNALNSLVDSIKFLFSVYTENMIEVFKLPPQGRRFNNYVKILQSFTNKIIQERKELFNTPCSWRIETTVEEIGIKRKLALLDLLLETSENGALLTDEEIREEVDTFTFEGHDTTTAAISWSLHVLTSHPDVQDKVYEELKDIFGDSDRPPTMKDLAEMKYLERVIKEALRLYPSVPMFARELREDVEIEWPLFLSTSSAQMIVFAINSTKEHFPNPEEFNPDNFLPEIIAERNPYAYIPFSAGPRNCIGQKFAILEEKTVLSYILRNYKLENI
ncbi:hypothetical protein L9F63_002531, partial [Diploptera punctata]